MPAAGQPQVTPQTFATSLLQTLGAPVTPQNVSSLVAWQAREGGNWHNTAAYNPLNTTLGLPGASSVNGVGVKAYQNWDQGLHATAQTLRNGKYGDILQALHAGQGLSRPLQGLRTWSGGGYDSLSGVGNYNPPAVAHGAVPAVAQARAVPGTAARGPRLAAGQAQVLKSVLAPLDAGMGSAVQGALFSKAQEHLLGAHRDLQTLAGPTTLNTHPATGEAGDRLATMVKAADALVGKPYVWGGGHSGFGPQPGYDCSGFVSAVLHAGGFLGAPQTTQTLPSQPSMALGPGKFVTIYDRTDGGAPNNDHVIIELNGAWYEAGGQAGPWGGGGGVARIQKPSAEYLSSFNRQLHPMGL